MARTPTATHDPLVLWLHDKRGTVVDVIVANDAGHGSFTREDVLADLAAFSAYGVREHMVLLRAPAGRAVLEPDPQHPDQLLTVTYHKDGTSALIQFWMNRSSLIDLVDAIRQSPDKAQNFDVVLDAL